MTRTSPFRFTKTTEWSSNLIISFADYIPVTKFNLVEIEHGFIITKVIRHGPIAWGGGIVLPYKKTCVQRVLATRVRQVRLDQS